MMKRFLIFASFLLFATVSFAQRGDGEFKKDRPSPEEKKKEMIARLDEAVNLSSAQEKQIEAILTDSHNKIKALEDKNGPKMEAMRAEMKAIMEKHKGDKEAMKDEMRAFKDEHKDEFEAMKEQIHQIKAESKAKIVETLNFDQKVAFFKDEDGRHGKHKGHHRPEKMKKYGDKSKPNRH